jgi:K(+)-stimulated pyrophosphate-energized sodium pump
MLDPIVMAGLFVGAALPFAFSAMTMRSVGKAAFAMIEEVRRQFRTIPGLLEGTAKPDYSTCVDISTQASLKEMMAPGLMVIITPLLAGWFFGVQMLAGLLIGSLIVGVMLAISMANSGGAWDNAKKYIETGQLGGKGSDTHKAAVVGDTVGDPFKDTSGPALNILIKLMAIISLVFVPFFMEKGGILLPLLGLK